MQLIGSEVKKAQGTEPQYKSIINYKICKKTQSYLGFILDNKGILFKLVKDHDKIFDTLVASKTLQRYTLHESISRHGHNGSSILCKLLKRQHYWKGLKNQNKEFVRHHLHCQPKTCIPQIMHNCM